MLSRGCSMMPLTSTSRRTGRPGRGGGRHLLGICVYILCNTLRVKLQKVLFCRILIVTMVTSVIDLFVVVPLRFGFVTFTDVASAQQALKNHDGCEVEGREIGLRFAEDRAAKSPGGGRGGGRGGGGFGRGGGGFGRGGGGFGRGGGRGFGRGGGRGRGGYL